MQRADIDEKDVVSLYLEGFDIHSIAELKDCSPSPIVRILRDPDLNPKGMRNRRVAFDEAKLVELYQSGLTGKEALTLVGAPVSRGWAVLRDPSKNPKGLRHEASVATRFQKRAGKFRAHGGYITCYVKPDHEFYEMANSGSCILEHRLVMAQHLGRPLKKTENVHHINGIRDDNRLENLELWQTTQPKGTRKDDKHCETCRCTED